MFIRAKVEMRASMVYTVAIVSALLDTWLMRTAQRGWWASNGGTILTIEVSG